MNFSGDPKPLFASVNTKQNEQNINRTFFFERPDGSVIFTEEREAWGLYSRVPQILGQRTMPFKFLGSSSGEKYRQAVVEAQQLFNETGDLAKAQERMRSGEKEELEVAKLTKIPPRNMDKVGPGADLLNV